MSDQREKPFCTASVGSRITPAILALIVLILSPQAHAQEQQRVSKWVTLGTNAGPIPNVRRMQPANLLQSDGTNILVDAGDGAGHQLAKAGVGLSEIDAVVISHLHFDHIGGLFALLGQRYQLRIPKVLTIYGPVGTQKIIDAIIEAVAISPDAGLRSETGPGEGVKVIEIADGSRFRVGDVAVTAAMNTHYSQSPHIDAQTSLSFRFNALDRSIVYTGDTGPSEAISRLAAGADLLVSEIFQTELALAVFKRSQPDTPPELLASLRQHFDGEHISPEQAGLMAQRAGVRSLVLTHNPTPPQDSEAMRDAIANNFKGDISFAEDMDGF